MTRSKVRRAKKLRRLGWDMRASWSSFPVALLEMGEVFGFCSTPSLAIGVGRHPFSARSDIHVRRLCTVVRAHMNKSHRPAPPCALEDIPDIDAVVISVSTTVFHVHLSQLNAFNSTTTTTSRYRASLSAVSLTMDVPASTQKPSRISFVVNINPTSSRPSGMMGTSSRFRFPRATPTPWIGGILRSFQSNFPTPKARPSTSHALPANI